MAGILIVEDEAQMRAGIKDNLEMEGYEVDEASDGEAGLEKAVNNKYDLIILDVMLPKMSGFDICREVRSKKINTPVIMLTAKGEEIDKVLGLELGADDYITKPFGLREFLARIKAILRRNPAVAEETEVEIGDLKLNFEHYTADNRGTTVSMTHREFEILKYLWKHRNQTVSRDELLNEIWGYGDMTTTRTVDNFILKLRQKVEQDPAHPRFIITVHGIGYKLVI